MTYGSACELENQASVRVDYLGACLDAGVSSILELCDIVLNEGRCMVNETNCDSLVFPEDGCCPVCGMSARC